MSTLRTFRFWFEPDRDFPRFRRLKWELAEVPIRDVLMDGIHPWMESPDGGDKHPSLIEAFLLQLNDEGSKVAALEQFGYCHDVSAVQSHYYEKKSRFERVLEFIQKNVCFVCDLTYLDLLEIAKNTLLDTWSNSTARALAEKAHPGFQELRHFLKTKDKSVKLSGFDDIGQYDLGRILSLADFEGQDSLLISEAIPSLNFRKASFLDAVTDHRGRLRLVPEITKVTMTGIPTPPDYVHLVWHVEREGETCRFCPDIGKSEAKRARAREFAQDWRVNEGRLCFRTSINGLVQMLEERVVVPSFPALNYTYEHSGPTATAEVVANRVQAFHIGRFRDHRNTGEQLKEILREYGVSMTGNKDKLLRKLAKLATEQYLEKKPELDAFFSEHCFVRIDATPPRTGDLPIIEEVSSLRNLLLSMYALKHLRGNAILEASHENNTYTEEELANALVRGKVAVNGAFLKQL